MLPLRLLLLLFACVAPVAAPAATILLEDGRTLTGDIGEAAGVAEDPTRPKQQNGGVRTTPILIIDDGLRRTFLNKFRVRDIIEAHNDRPVIIRVWQDHAEHGAVVGAVGRQVRVSPFDKYGRRIYEMRAAGGSLAIVQGITEVTPIYTRVEGLKAEPRNYVWDQRLATSSIPRQTLSMILKQASPPDSSDARLQIVRLYLQSERFTDARRELESIIADFPDLKDLQPEVRRLRQMGADAILKEINLRRDAGQHEFVRLYLENFPAEQIEGQTLEKVRERLEEVDKLDARIKQVHELIEKLVASIKEPKVRVVAEEIQAEIKAELNHASLGRMTAFVNLAGGQGIGGGEGLDTDRQAALAISGWLLGSNNATDNLAVALSLFDVRAHVVAYLRAPLAAERERRLNEIRDSEGGDVERVAQLLKMIKPPLDLPEEQQSPGVYELSTPIGPGKANVRYLVQLPPEYDPLRRYPVILTLNGEGFRPEMQLDYWAGGQGPDGARRGQAMRHGYITIAVDWQRKHQFEYDYSATEHQKIMAVYRDAMRRLAIDSDRVYLTGHDIGANAAWDMALAHPDLWAGVIPILPEADKFIKFYSKNARYVPWYFVCGELDGDKIEKNAFEFDRYLKPYIDATVVEFLGRGHEPFNDEIQRLFDWMGRKTRPTKPPEEFEVSSMRPWDNFFWWVEFQQLPGKSMVTPQAWPPGRGTRAARLRGREYEGNKLAVFAQAGRTIVWLTPDAIDFDKPIDLELNGRRMIARDQPVQPQLEILLEDARTRGDRFRPFWAKVESP